MERLPNYYALAKIPAGWIERNWVKYLFLFLVLSITEPCKILFVERLDQIRTDGAV